MFQKLVKYKKQHKNTMVPNCSGEDTKLGWLVFTQRRRCKIGALLPRRFDLLNSVGFDWEGVQGRKKKDNKKWMSMFQRLVEYKKQHRSTAVPKKYDEDPKLGESKLGEWDSKQRRLYKNNQLLPNRYALLNSVRFEWVGVIGRAKKI